MKVLFVCHRFPFPPNSGAKIRSFNMIKHLSASHDVTVASLVRSTSEMEQAAGIAPYCARYSVHRVRDPVQLARMVISLPTSTPASMAYFRAPTLAAEIRTLLATQRFDLIVAHSSSVAQYVEDADGIPKLMDFCDIDSQKWLDYARHLGFPRRLAYAVEGRKLESEERRIASRFDLCTVATIGELRSYERLGSGTEGGWFPNGVDADYFSPSQEPYDPDLLVFVGKMDYYPNEECVVRFCTGVLPRLRERRPSTRFVIVGADPSPAVRRLADMPGVTVTGTVDDVRPHVRRAAAMIATLAIARGTQNKILEGMAMGIPVVASPIAASGIDAQAPEHLRVASPDDEVDVVSSILDNPAERARLAASGRARVLSHHDWAASMRRFDRLIERCIEIAAMRRERVAA